MDFDFDAVNTRMLHAYLDSLDECEHMPEDDEPDPDRFRDDDPNELDREDY